MSEGKMYDITDVCKMLGTTSRALRFYEEKGIITSTTTDISCRRKYTEKQLSNIKNVLVLRTLGLSVKSIIDLQKDKSDLREAVISKRAEIYASIDTRIKEINLLNEALYALDSGKSIFCDIRENDSIPNERILEIVKLCTDYIVNNNTELLYCHVGSKLAEYMPMGVFNAVRRDTLAPVGEFVSMDQIVADGNYSYQIYSKVRYSRLGLKITFVFCHERIEGLWLGYYDINER